MATYTVVTGDVIVCDVNATLSGSTLTYTTMFNFHPGESVQRNWEKQTYIYKRPGLPIGFEIGMAERLFSVTTQVTNEKLYTGQSASTHKLTDLVTLAQEQWNVNTTAGRKSKGIVKFYYYGDKRQSTLYYVIFKSLSYEQRAGLNQLIDVRAQFSEVAAP